MRINLPLHGVSERSAEITNQRMLNMYLEVSQEGAKGEYALIGVPGLTAFKTVGSGPIRAMAHDSHGSWFVISAGQIYADVQDTPRLLGTVPASGTIHMVTNLDGEIAILVGSQLFIATVNDLTTVTDIDYPRDANHLIYQDSRFILTRPNGEFYISAIDDGTSWAALDFATAERHPDGLVGGLNADAQLLLFGEDSTEIWQNTGNATFPYERNNQGDMEKGLKAASSVAKDGVHSIWLGPDGVFYSKEGRNAVRISNHDIEARIAKWSNIENANAFIFNSQGHVFYAFSHPEGCVVFDAITSLWHERQTYGQSRWRAACHLKFTGTDYVGDGTSNQIYSIDASAYAEGTDPLVSKIVTPTIGDEKKRLRISSVVLDIDSGVGLNTGQGEDPQVMMRYSDDAGRTWSQELWRTMGVMGAYEARPQWNRLGQSRARVYEFSISDPVKRVITGAYQEFVSEGQETLGGRLDAALSR